MVVDDFSAQASLLRQRLVERPKSARIKAQLAYVVAQQSLADDSAPLHAEALELAQQAIDMAPSKPFGYIGLSMIERDNLRRIKAIRQALACQLDAANRVVLLTRLLVEPREEEARKVAGSIGKASGVHPSRRALDAKEEGIYKELQEALDHAWAADPSVEETEKLTLREYRLGLFFRKRQPPESYQPRAVLHFERVRQRVPIVHPSAVLASFWLATMSDTVSLDRCPADYVIGLYSTFAKGFDELLVEKLHYKTPTLLRYLVDESVHQTTYSRAADLGCGTGLSGVAFKDCVETLVGVDLSPEMIAKAKGRQCYHQLVVGEVTEILGATDVFDLIVSCDVFVYIGALETVFAKVESSLVEKGIFAFSNELLDESSPQPYNLHTSARFAHKRSYIQALARASGLNIIAMKVAPIRLNEGKDVVGLLTVLRRD